MHTYPLISSQQMVAFMWKYALHRQAAQIPCAVLFSEPLDLSLLKRAVNVEIERNDCLRLRLTREKGGLRQYFLPAYRLEDIPVRTFRTQAETDAALNAAAGEKLRVFQGETFRLLFFTAPDGRRGVFLNVSHFVMDGAAVFTFFQDLLAVYEALRTGAPMPRALAAYEELIRKELADETLPGRAAAQTRALANWLEKDGPPVYCSVKGTPGGARGTKALKPGDYFPLFDKAAFTKQRFSREESEALRRFVTERQISPEWVLQLGLRAALGKLNGVTDTLFWVLCPRRRTVAEKRCGGTLASPLPWRALLPETLTFEEAVRALAATQAFLFRHTDVPFTALRETERNSFGYNPLQTANSMMFSYLPFAPEAFGGREYEFLGLNMGRYVMPLYTVALYDAYSGCYKLNYYHRTHTYTEADIRRFHARAARAVLAGVRAPGKTLKEIMEEL